jgi:hypothetical protein
VWYVMGLFIGIMWRGDGSDVNVYCQSYMLFNRAPLTLDSGYGVIARWKGKWKVFGGASDSNAIMSAGSDGASYTKIQGLLSLSAMYNSVDMRMVIIQ